MLAALEEDRVYHVMPPLTPLNMLAYMCNTEPAWPLSEAVKGPRVAGFLHDGWAAAVSVTVCVSVMVVVLVT